VSLALLALVVAGIAARVHAAGASGLGGFHTPGWAAGCVVAENVLGGPSPLICSTPNDGFTVRMYAASAATHSYEPSAKGYHDYYAGRRLLAFGDHWGFRITYVGYLYRCTSRSSGLTCTNQAGHGWWLGRYRGYRLF
jgi:hypothetical protein